MAALSDRLSRASAPAPWRGAIRAPSIIGKVTIEISQRSISRKPAVPGRRLARRPHGAKADRQPVDRPRSRSAAAAHRPAARRAPAGPRPRARSRPRRSRSQSPTGSLGSCWNSIRTPPAPALARRLARTPPACTMSPPSSSLAEDAGIARKPPLVVDRNASSRPTGRGRRGRGFGGAGSRQRPREVPGKLPEHLGERRSRLLRWLYESLRSPSPSA